MIMRLEMDSARILPSSPLGNPSLDLRLLKVEVMRA